MRQRSYWKKAGFPQEDGLDVAYYTNDGKLREIGEFVEASEEILRDTWDAPTQAVTMRWLRSRDIFINVGILYTDDYDEGGRYDVFFYEVKIVVQNEIYGTHRLEVLEYNDDEEFCTFEQAAEEWIKAACKYIIENEIKPSERE